MMIVVTSDGHSFDVSKEIADLSDFLRDANEDDELVIPNVAAREFKHILRFCQMHVDEPMKHIPTPMKHTDLHEYVGTTFTEFVNSVDVHSELVPLILAADFLGIDPLVSLLCAKMAILAQTSDSVDTFLSQFSPEFFTV
jgi:hypothetical protein